jgi:hypothetical protein
MHAAVVWMVFVWLRLLFTTPALITRWGSAADPLAFACALLWGVHPLNSEAVNYVTQRTELLMGLCYVLTLYCSLRALRAPAGSGGTWTIAAVLACAAGMACKESMVTAPVMVLLIDRTLVFGSFREQFTARRRLYMGLAATWLVLMALLAGAPRTSAGFGSGTSSWVYLLNQARMLPQYVKLTFWPHALVLDYGLPPMLTIGDVLVPALVVVVLLVVAAAAWFWFPAAGLVGAWFFLTLAPTSSIVPISTEVGAERRMYLPLLALVVLSVTAVYRLLSTRIRVAAALLVAVAILMIAGVIVRNRDYASELTMAQTIVERWPSGRSRYSLGTLLIEAGQHDAGMAQLRMSAVDYPGALFAIGTEQLGAGDLASGIETLRRFVQLMPNHVNVVPARDALARAYAIQNNLAASEQELRLLLATAPDYLPGRNLLGRVLAGQGRYGEAAAEFRRVLSVDPANAEARETLALLQRGAASSGTPAAAP